MFDKDVPQIDKPNVIWILRDQHRAHALSCNGNSNINTPNIDFNPRYSKEIKRLNDRLKRWIIDTGDRFELPEF